MGVLGMHLWLSEGSLWGPWGFAVGVWGVPGLGILVRPLALWGFLNGPWEVGVSMMPLGNQGFPGGYPTGDAWGVAGRHRKLRTFPQDVWHGSEGVGSFWSSEVVLRTDLGGGNADISLGSNRF